MAHIFVTSYKNPDLDGVASSLAYAELLRQQGREAEAVLWGKPQPEVGYFIKNFGLLIPKASNYHPSEADRFVVVDTSVTKRLPKEIDPKMVVEIVDHHPAETGEEFPHAKIQNEGVGAVATLVFERCSQEGIKLPKDLARVLYSAIFHNTQNLTSGFGDRDVAAVQKLEEEYGFNREMITAMFESTNIYTLKHLAEVINGDLKEIEFEGKKCQFGQLTMFGQKDLRREVGDQVVKVAEDLGRGGDLVIMNVSDIRNNCSDIYTCEPGIQAKLEEGLGVKFEANWVKVRPLAKRKQLVVKLGEK